MTFQADSCSNCSICLFHLALYPVNGSLPISTLSSNYRPISLLCVLSKVLEQCIHNHSYQHLHRLSTIGNTVSSGVNRQHNCWRYTTTSWNLLLVVKKLMPYTSICQKLFTKYNMICSCRNLRILGSVGLSYLGIKATSVIGDNELFFMVSVLTGFRLRLVCRKALYSVRYCFLFIAMRSKNTFRLNHHSHSSLTTPNFTHLFIFLLPCSSLQDNLNNLLKWSVDMKMKFNPKKCKVMHISRKKLPNKHQYNLDGQSLEQVTNIKDLGITVSSDLSWSKHIEVTAAKANKTLGLIKRICRDINDCATRRLLYCSLVRPKLEYASNVWSPSTVKYSATSD